MLEVITVYYEETDQNTGGGSGALNYPDREIGQRVDVPLSPVEA